MTGIVAAPALTVDLARDRDADLALDLLAYLREHPCGE
jgi:hypothetical protein